jgi:predicted protein tyrosine phosphatase
LAKKAPRKALLREEQGEQILGLYNTPKFKGVPHMMVLSADGKLIHDEVRGDFRTKDDGKGLSHHVLSEFLKRCSPEHNRSGEGASSEGQRRRSVKVLFICSQNMLRSPTAETVFSVVPGLEVASAGTEPDAGMPVSADLVEWAEIILVMEPRHRRRMQEMFGSELRDKKLVVLGIPDNYEYMDPELIAVLKRLVPPHLRLTPEQLEAMA